MGKPGSSGYNRDFLVLPRPAVVVVVVERQYQIPVKIVMGAPAYLRQNVLELIYQQELLPVQGSNSQERGNTEQMVDQGAIYT